MALMPRSTSCGLASDSSAATSRFVGATILAVRAWRSQPEFDRATEALTRNGQSGFVVSVPERAAGNLTVTAGSGFGISKTSRHPDEA